MNEAIGYANVKCHFNFPGCKKNHAGYSRAEDDNPRGAVFDACENCVRKPNPQPDQFREEKKDVVQSAGIVDKLEGQGNSDAPGTVGT